MRKRAPYRPFVPWTNTMLVKLARLLDEGRTYQEIANALGVIRNAVAGKAFRIVHGNSKRSKQGVA